MNLIAPFFGDLRDLLDEPEISEIMVNGSGEAWIERDGLLLEVPGVVLPEAMRQNAAMNIARLLGKDISSEIPLLDARLPDGSRVAAAMPPASVGGTVLNIRKFRAKRFTVDELVERGMLTNAQLDRLAEAVRRRETILISGGCGAGKTSLLNALAEYVPPQERILIIEDTAEISLPARNLVRFEARPEHHGAPAVTIGDLLRQALRHRPDRIILGEVRGAEAFDLLQAWNTGHAGSLSTIHANSAALALSRLRTCVSMADVLPDRAIARSIADSIALVAHIERRAGRREVSEILELSGYDPDTDKFQLA